MRGGSIIKLRDCSATFFVVSVAVWLLASPPAYAYIDPGTGSYLFQLLIASLLGGAVAGRLFWKNIVDFFQKLKAGRRPGADDEE